MKAQKLPSISLGAAALLAAIIPLVACSDGSTEPDQMTVADLAGAWFGSQFSISSQANPRVGIDVVAAGGTVTVAIQPSGTFSGTAAMPGFLIGTPQIGVVTVPMSGVFRLLGENTLRMDFIPEIPPLFVAMNTSFTYSGDVLTVTDPNTEFDFDNDGTGEPAVFQASLRRN